jgi:hypothetical protein
VTAPVRSLVRSTSVVIWCFASNAATKRSAASLSCRRAPQDLTLRGSVVNPQSLTAPSDARAWLIWSPETGDAVVSSQSAVVSSIPGTYELDGVEPPDAVIGENGASGMVLFMTDAQKDLVLAQLASGGEIDVGVMGIAQTLVNWFPDAESAAAEGALFANGFNLLSVVASECTNDAGDVFSCDATGIVPSTTEIPIDLFDSDAVQGFPALHRI